MTIPVSAETIGFSQVGAESDWRTALSADMRKEASQRDIDLRFDDAHGSIDRQFAAVRRFIAERVDAIVIAPVVVPGWTPVLTEAKAAHIPVFIADRSVDSDPSLFVARIGNDTNLEGRPAASWLAQASRGRCTIVELQGTLGSAPAIGREMGFGGIIAQFPAKKIIRSESGDFTEEGGRQVTTSFIQSTGRLKDVYAV
jgi:ABC-type sugar transport system substrate-binding protein